MKYLILMLLSLNANAAETWLCTEASSERVDGAVKACGVGSGSNEDQARAAAFSSAQGEFERICKLSDDCSNHETSVKPGRTTCDNDRDGYKCFRLLTFTIGNKRNSVDARALQGGSVNGIKIKKGMSKKEMLAMMGTPVMVQQIGEKTLFNFRSPKVCTFRGCGVWVYGAQVLSYHEFQPLYTDELD